MRVRDATPADRAAIFAVHAAAFRTEREAEVAVALDPEASLVAEEDGRVVGHVVLSRLAVEDGYRAVALGPIGVLPEAQGRGLGSALVRAALAAARDAGEDAVVLLGNPAYYGRFGFVAATSVGLPDPFGWRDAFQIVVLGAPPPRGAVPLWPRPFLVAGTPAAAVQV